MKTVITLITLVFVISACSEENIDINKETQAITQLLNKQAQCYKTKDINCMMETYINDSTTTAYGTKKDFVGSGWNEIKNLFENEFQGSWKMLEYKYLNPTININKDNAWLVCDVQSKIQVEIPNGTYDMRTGYRLTAMVRKTENDWKFSMTNYQDFGTGPTIENQQIEQ